jgi:hypothetical protein
MFVGPFVELEGPQASGHRRRRRMEKIGKSRKPIAALMASDWERSLEMSLWRRRFSGAGLRKFWARYKGPGCWREDAKGDIGRSRSADGQGWPAGGFVAAPAKG